MKYLVVDAFAEEIFGGNPAGVVLLPDGEDYPADDVMVKIAAEFRYSETAFIKQLSQNDFQVRYFTPVTEVDLCGHATIGSFCALAHLGIVADGSKVTAHTLAGDLAIEVKGRNVMMEMASPKLVSVISDTTALSELYKVMGLPAGAEVPVWNDPVTGEARTLYPAIVSTGLPDIMMPVASQAALDALAPDMPALAALSDWYGVTGVHAFTMEAAADAGDGEKETAHARNFGPACGIDEEAATGTASGAMTYYLYKNGLLGDEADCMYIQGEAMGRPSVIRAELRKDGAGDPDGEVCIRVGGSAAVLAEGELYL